MTEEQFQTYLVALIAAQLFSTSENKNGAAMRDIVVRSWQMIELIEEVKRLR